MQPYCKLVLFILFQSTLTGQIDTVFIPTIEVGASPLRSQVVGSSAETWDSLDLYTAESNLSDLLNQTSGIFLKNYGLGSLSTSSVRGGSASHTAVTWNGFLLTSPMLGQLDFSLLPSFFFDEVKLIPGSNSSSWGSGNVSGLVQLNTQSPFTSKLRVKSNTTIGSFGHQQQELSLGGGYKQLTFNTRAYYIKADNDFTYQIRADLPKIEQSNFAQRQKGLLQEVHFIPKDNQLLSIYFWLQNAYREIPPQTTQNRSLANQTDDILRATATWKRVGNRSIWQIRTGFFQEYIDYQDPIIKLVALSDFKRLVQEVEQTWFMDPKCQVNWGINYNWTEADADGYVDPSVENQLALFANFKRQLNKFDIQIGMRQSLVNESFMPFIPSLGLNYQWSDWLRTRLKLSRNFRYPTLNDRFWSPGGNPALLPERGWSQEIGLDVQLPSSNNHISYRISVYNRNINNWIRWAPIPDSPIWFAQNVAKVWSRGIEQRAQFQFTQNQSQLIVKLGHDLTFSTHQIGVPELNITAGEQLLYTPQNQAFVTLEWVWKKLRLQYHHRYTSPIQTIVEDLEGYQVAQFNISYTPIKRALNSTVFLQIENVWDETYRIIERRPMPGRHYRLGLQIRIS